MSERTRYQVKEIYIESVKVVDRHRKDLGDIDSLARSIKDLGGLINPITVAPDGTLIAGHRRLEACRQLGWLTIDARFAETLDSAVERLKAERDENTERKPMTPEELVSVGQALEELERPKAKARQGARTDLTSLPRDNEVGRNAHHNKTHEVVADALGVSPMSYYRSKKVVEAANDPTLPPEDREAAQAALADMNATGNVSGNYEKVRKRQRTQTGARPAKATLNGAGQQRKAITNAIATLSGVAHGLDQIETIHTDITNTEAAQWVDGLSDARRAITVLITRLKERNNATA